MPDDTDLKEWVFTFGLGNPFLGDKYVVIRAYTADEAREEMCSYFGTKWAFQYTSREAAGADKYGLRELEPFSKRGLKYGR
jgi:hypothetical protein